MVINNIWKKGIPNLLQGCRPFPQPPQHPTQFWMDSELNQTNVGPVEKWNKSGNVLNISTDHETIKPEPSLSKQKVQIEKMHSEILV